MEVILQQEAEQRIIAMVKEAAKKFSFDVTVDGDFRPGTVILSQVLLSISNAVGRALDVSIPESCYPFYDKAAKKQLSIKEAVTKLAKVAKRNAN